MLPGRGASLTIGYRGVSHLVCWPIGNGPTDIVTHPGGYPARGASRTSRATRGASRPFPPRTDAEKRAACCLVPDQPRRDLAGVEARQANACAAARVATANRRISDSEGC